MSHLHQRVVRALVAGVFVSLLFSTSTWAAFGRTKGSGNVSDAGQAGYSIPLFTPPGTNGRTPALSLNYSSGGGEGPFGFGWTLGGQSGISRCKSTWAQDGSPRNVYNLFSDRFCLDGSKLRLISGTYGGAGSVYRTEVESYSRVTAYGTSGNGPAYFIVERKDGLIYEYGNSEDSRIQSVGFPTVRSWSINKIRDRSGNAIVFSYTEDTTNGSFRLSTIQYTQNTTVGTSPTYTVTFNYASLPAGEVDSRFVASSIVKRIVRATSIDVSSPATLIRRYLLTYEANLSNTAKSRLQSVQECAGASGTDCLAATTFVYQNGTPGVSTEVNSGVTIPTTNSMPLDVNGDGRTDVVYPSGSVWMVMFANASGGYNTPVNTGITNTNSSQAIPLDYNADGLDDFLVPYSGGTWWVIQGTTIGLAAPVNTSITATGAGGNARAMDVNGDGLEDLVFAIVSGSQHSVQVRLRVWGSTFGTASYLYGPITAPSQQIVGPVFGTTQFRNRKRNPDINGDGLADVVVHTREPEPEIGYIHFWEVVRSGGQGPVVISNLDINAGPYWPDLNGDGCSDLVYARGSNWKYRFGDCFGVGAEINGPLVTGFSQNQAVVYDWDGDGFDDIVGRNTTTGRWDYMRSNGEALQAIVDSGIATSANGQPHIGDANGDGLDDLLYGNASNVRMHHSHAGVTPDLLLTATDGLGQFTTFAYTTLPQNNYTKGSGNGLSFPYVDWQGPTPVVASKQSSDGNGGSYFTNYWYYGAVKHLQGRGLAGFWKVRLTDSRNGIVNYNFFDQQFPLAGALKKSEVWQPSESMLVSRTTITNTPVVIDSTLNNERHAAYPSAVVSQDYEVSTNPTFNGIFLRTVSTANSFDSATGVIYDKTVTTAEPVSGANGLTPGGVWTERTYMPLANLLNNTTTWCIGRPGQVQQINSHNLTYGASITRTTNLTWNATDCRPTQLVEEPGSGTLQVTTDIGYDSFGNVNSQTVTGVGMTARTSTTSYSDLTHTTGQFPLSTTNALNQTSTFSWNYDLGVPISRADPNGISTSYQYDNFGRRTREDRADGTATTWSINNCTAVSGGCVGASNKTIVIETALASGGAYVNDAWNYLDVFDRSIITTTRTAGGSYNRVNREFDSLGRLYRQSAPCIWASCTNYWTTNTYDVVNRATAVSRPISDSNSTLQTTLTFFEGLTTRIVDSQSKQSVRVSNAYGQVYRSTDHDNYYQAFEYDAFGNPKRIQDTSSNVLLTSTYNLRGMLTQRVDMNMGTWSFTPNALGETVSQTDAKSQTTTFVFDLLGRLTSRTEAEGTSTWIWGTSSAAKNIGKLSSIAGPGYSESYIYDSIGRPSSTSITADVTYQIDYAYNSIGALDTLTYPTSTSSYRLKLQYDYQYGQPYRIKDFNVPSTVFWTANAVNGRNQITQETLGNGLVTNRAYDAVTGWLKTVQTGASGGTGVQNLAYTWDLVGNLNSRKDVNQSNLTESFVYDNLYRLDYSQLNGVTNLDMAYDALGNITSKSDVGTYTYHSTKKHQVVSTSNGWSFGYDNNGNMTNVRGATMTWTSYNYVSQISNAGLTSDFYYSPNRGYFKQVATFSNGTATTIYVGGILEKVTTTSGTDYRHMIRAGSATIIVSRQTSGTNSTNYVTSDHLGSSSAITNSSGGILVNSSFDAFGKRRGANWAGSPSAGDWTAIASTTRRGYTDHSMLDNVNFIHMNGRVQDPLLGRFVSADPFITEPNRTQNYNRYSYVYNNPLSAIDPSGFGKKDPPCHTNCVKPEEDGAQEMQEVRVEARRPETARDSGRVGDVVRDAILRGGSAGGSIGESEAGLETIVVTGIRQGPPKYDTISVDTLTKQQQADTGSCPQIDGLASLLPRGGGVSMGGIADAGVPGLAGAAAQVSTGAGAFVDANGNVSTGDYVSGGAVAYAGNAVAGAPRQDSQPRVLGAAVGGGFSGFLTNAQSVHQLSGHFRSITANVGIGPFQISVNVSFGNGIWQASFSPPVAGVTAGLSVTDITTNTETSGGGCH